MMHVLPLQTHVECRGLDTVPYYDTTYPVCLLL